MSKNFVPNSTVFNNSSRISKFLMTLSERGFGSQKKLVKSSEYLANKKYRNLDNKDGLRVTEKELVAVLMRESNFKKTTFCFKGDPIPFSVVKEVLNL